MLRLEKQILDLLEGPIGAHLMRHVDRSTGTVGTSRTLIQRHTAATEANFQAWLAAAVVSATTPEARRTLKANLAEELKDDHASLLRTFARAAKAEPVGRTYTSVARPVRAIRRFVGMLSGLENVTLMFVLEQVYQDFIMTSLCDAARRLGSRQLRYATLHCVADKRHSAEMLRAVVCEAAGASRARERVTTAVSFTLDQLRKIYVGG